MGGTAPHPSSCTPPGAQAHRDGWPSNLTGSARGRDFWAAFVFPVIAGGVLAAYNPMLAMGAGGLTVFVAAAYKKDWCWWLVGILILVLAVSFLLNKKDENK